MHQISLVFSSHRPETLSLSAPLMESHEAIFLEEPPTAGFESLLQGTLPLEDYLLAVDMEFPEFFRQTCALLQTLHEKQKKILQVEPYLETLAGIHEFFADGGSPRDLVPDSEQFTVYQAEKKATSALLQYYQTVIKGSFEETIETVKTFARADAARLLLRDSLRARALVSKVLKFSRAYVEAGYMHYALRGKLTNALSGRAKLQPIFLMAPIVKPLLGKRQAFGPGDLLTLLYLYHPKIRGAQVDLMAARSLVFIKLLEKQEMEVDDSLYPHTHNELKTIQMTQILTFGDCKRLFPEIRLAKTNEALTVVQTYLSRKRERSQNQEGI
jgi:hypothetical protein